MGWCSCSDLSEHQGFAIFFGLCSGIAGIVALALNDKSECAESYQTLMVLGIGLTAFSVFYFLNCFISKGLKKNSFPFLVLISGIFVFILDCMLINDMVRGNQSDDCSGGRGTLRLFVVVSTVPFQLIVCAFSQIGSDPQKGLDYFYLRPSQQDAEFQILL
jgi:hypothetical protein